MRIFASSLLFVTALGISALDIPATHATTYPAVMLLSGEMDQTVVSNLCYIVRGPTEFQRNADAKKAYITIAEMTAGGFQLNGKVNLAFSDAASGTANFIYTPDYPASIQSITFQSYSQSYNATSKILTVHFKLNFPNCVLPVFASYTSS